MNVGKEAEGVEIVTIGGRLGNRSNPQQAAAAGRTVPREEAERFAANIRPIIESIGATGVITFAGIAEALNTRGLRSARGSKRHASSVMNLIARSTAQARAIC